MDSTSIVTTPGLDQKGKPTKTGRDIPAKIFLPYLSQFLKESGKINYRRIIPKMGQSALTSNQNYLDELEKFYCHVSASTLFQIYLHPCFQIPLLKSPGGSQASKAQKIMQAACFNELVELGWIIKDRTGIMYASQECIERIDSIASHISQEHHKNT